MIRRRVTAVLIVAAALTSLMMPAQAQTPALNITITDNAQIVKPNTAKHYVVTLTNTGTASVSGVLVVTVPSYATPRSDDPKTVQGSDVSWTVTVAPGDKVTRELDTEIGKIPAGERFVTTLASFYLDGNTAGPPTVRSADADRLPGVPDPRTTKPERANAKSDDGPNWLPIVVIAVGVVVLTAVAWTLGPRRRRRY